MVNSHKFFDSERFASDLRRSYRKCPDVKNLDMFWDVILEKYPNLGNEKITRHSMNQLMKDPTKTRLSSEQIFSICDFFNLDYCSYYNGGES